jgi:SET domain-containing protein
VRSQQILSRQQQTEETLQINSHLNTLETKLRQVTQEKAELQAQLRTLSPDSKGSKQKIPRSNSLPVTPLGGTSLGGGNLTKKSKDFEEEANENLINELTQKSLPPSSPSLFSHAAPSFCAPV